MNDKTAKELRRQLAHASGIALVPLAFVLGKFPAGAAAFLAAFIIFILAEHGQYGNGKKSNRGADKSAEKNAPVKSFRNGIHSIPNSIHIVFEKFERGGGNYRGAFYFYLSSAVSLFLFPEQIAALSITVLALGDSASTAAGIFGKRKIFYNRKKTWEGTLAGFALAFAGCLPISPHLAFYAAFIGMLAESLPLKVDDNLTIPILTGIALSVISRL